MRKHSARNPVYRNVVLQRESTRPLTGHVAVVAGATRGAGRGIARALGEAGATVYCTGRSVRGNPSPYGRPETIDETADMINAAGGIAIALRVDHTVESEVAALFARVDREHGRLDVLVNGIAGEDPMMGQWGSFWKADLTNAEAIFRQSLVSHIITAKYGAPIMIRLRRGLIVEVTENDVLGGGGNPMASGQVSSSARGNSAGNTISPTTTAAGPTGEGWRSISRFCPHRSWICSEPAPSFRSSG